jgi:hypothetical protein
MEMFTSLQTWFEVGIAASGIMSGLVAGVFYAKRRFYAEKRKEMEEASIGVSTSSSFQAKHTIIHETLTGLRVKTNACRARIGHFHNGGKFLDGTPMKKFSITHESCERGVPYDGANLQNILVTMFWDLVETMRENNPRLHMTESMREGYFRSYNKSNGIVAYAILPIMKEDLYVGFIELEWFEPNKLPTMDEIKELSSTFEQSRDYTELELALR